MSTIKYACVCVSVCVLGCLSLSTLMTAECARQTPPAPARGAAGTPLPMPL